MPRVVIAGGGYAGLRVASILASRLNRSWSIELVDTRHHHELLTRLPEVAIGDLDARYARIPFAEVLPERVRFRRERVLSLNPKVRSVQLESGELAADFLIVAFGSVTDFLQVPGAREYSRTLRSVEEAERLQAALRGGRRTGWRLRVLVVGAGYTGTEMAGELSGKRHSRHHEVHLVAEDHRLLPQGNERLAYAAEKRLRACGVRFSLDCHVEAVMSEGDMIDGVLVPADLVVWAARAIPSWPDSFPTFTYGSDRRIEVDEHLQAIGFEGIYAIGDSANARDSRTGVPVPASAQLALQEAETAAANILAKVEGTRLIPFRPRSLGEALSLGPDDGVAEIAGVVVTGRAAITVKRAALARYVFELGGTRLAWRYRL